MMMGSIPITNYPHLMTPPLQHGANCLAFHTIPELQTLLRQLPIMNDSEVESLRLGVLAYAHEHLDPQAVGLKLRAALGTVHKVAFNDESGR